MRDEGEGSLKICRLIIINKNYRIYHNRMILLFDMRWLILSDL